MKKIMFNDACGLTQAVLEGKKTQTRRIVTYPKTFHGKDVCGFYVCKRVSDGVVTDVCMYDEDESFIDEGQILPKYKIGEVVAVAQRYKDIFSAFSQHPNPQLNIGVKNPTDTAGWNNKMFVKGELMPHQIRITNVRIQRLQDISDEDCLAEGIIKKWHATVERDYYYIPGSRGKLRNILYKSAREAYAALIDKISGKGTWDSNPWVWAYTFELVK